MMGVTEVLGGQQQGSVGKGVHDVAPGDAVSRAREASFYRLVDQALRSEADRADPGALKERVQSIPATVEPEHRRWWHRSGIGALRSAGANGTQVRGANNMLAATRIAAIVAALALGTTFLAVQVGGPPPAAQQPGAPTSDSWVMVTGTQVLVGDGPEGMKGRMLNVSDPRLKGEVLVNYETGPAEEERPATFWSSVTITNDEGSWRGQSIGFADQDEAHHHSGWFEGDDAYEGFVFVYQMTEGNPSSPSGGTTLDVIGLVYEGELPPMVLPAWAPATD